MSIMSVAETLDIDWLKRANRAEWVGPCPVCGGHEKPGSDRFGLNDDKGVMNCRKCGLTGDAIALVMAVKGLEFMAAIDWMCGPRDAADPAGAARKRKLAEDRARVRTATADRMRADAMRAAVAIWKGSVPGEGTPVRDYLERRGVTRAMMPVMPICLRFDRAAKYMVPDARARGEWRHVFTGPAMVAAVQGPDRALIGVHRTWLDLSQPKGKAVHPHPFRPGEVCDAKKGLGSKKGGAIRLLTPNGADTLVMGEGIETTLSAMVAGVYPGAAFWASIDLGNIAGKRAGRSREQSAIPDMTDADAFIPPAWCRRLILIMDGDSNPASTRAQIEAGARRAMVARPGLRAQVVECPAGRDLNDVLMGVGS